MWRLTFEIWVLGVQATRCTRAVRFPSRTCSSASEPVFLGLGRTASSLRDPAAARINLALDASCSQCVVFDPSCSEHHDAGNRPRLASQPSSTADGGVVVFVSVCVCSRCFCSSRMGLRHLPVVDHSNRPVTSQALFCARFPARKADAASGVRVTGGRAESGVFLPASTPSVPLPSSPPQSPLPLLTPVPSLFLASILFQLNQPYTPSALTYSLQVRSPPHATCQQQRTRQALACPDAPPSHAVHVISDPDADSCLARRRAIRAHYSEEMLLSEEGVRRGPRMRAAKLIAEHQQRGAGGGGPVPTWQLRLAQAITKD